MEEYDWKPDTAPLDEDDDDDDDDADNKNDDNVDGYFAFINKVCHILCCCWFFFICASSVFLFYLLHSVCSIVV